MSDAMERTQERIRTLRLERLAPEMAARIERLRQAYDTRDEQRAILALCALADRLREL